MGRVEEMQESVGDDAKLGMLERARQLQALSVKRNLTPVELEEAAGLVTSLSGTRAYAAAWAHDSIRRTYKRLKSEDLHQGFKSLFQQTMECVRRCNGQRVAIDMNRAPANEVLVHRSLKSQGAR